MNVEWLDPMVDVTSLTNTDNNIREVSVNEKVVK